VIKELSEVPPNVIGFEVSGKVQAEDFRDVVLPAFEKAAKTGGIELSLSSLSSRECRAALCGRT
jgi:hypothetical protein